MTKLPDPVKSGIISDEHIVYEEDCLRNPYSTKAWLRYVEFVESLDQKIFLLKRAVNQLPRSYKLWKLLLSMKVDNLFIIQEGGKRIPKPEFPLNHREWQVVNGLFEKCLVLCNKFPLIWEAYCEFLIYQSGRITFTRRTFDRALKALPVGQHKKLWNLYLESFSKNVGGDTTVRVWRRFLKIQPSYAEHYVSTLLALDPPRNAEAARVLTAIIESPVKYANPNGKTVYEYWMWLCQIITKHAGGIEMPQQDHLVPESEFELAQRPDRLDVELILRTGIKKFSDQVGKLWVSLAKWWTEQKAFERARDVYEEGIRTVSTVEDFIVVFDAYAASEERILSRAMESLAQLEAQGKVHAGLDAVDVDLRLARFEKLMERRPFLLNDVLLRQSPNNVNEWKNRVALYLEKKDFVNVVNTYKRGCETIHPHRATGSLTQIWVDYAKFHEERNELALARSVFKAATKVDFAKVDELAHIWCQWAEMEIRSGHFNEALKIIGGATAPLSGNLDIAYDDLSKTPQQRLFKCVKLWSFYVDLQESVGTVESTKAVYDRILELKIAVPQIIINYASFLEENKYFEESFRVYERGIELFGYPIAYEIWNLYLTKFIQRYEGTKLERARDLFEQALENCPAKHSKNIFLLYAQLEEEYGLARHALRIYDRATKSVDPSDLYDLFVVYISKAASFFGIIATRDIYTKALEILPDKPARDMAIQFADMEVKLGEVDRARAVLAYTSQLCDPRSDAAFWKNWHEFEVKYGNEDTYKEMLRLKRSVQAKFNSDVNFIASQILASRGIDTDGQVQPSADDDNNQTRVVGFVRAEKTEPKVTPTVVVNPDEIALDDESSSDEEEEERPAADQVEKKAIPAAVFGGLASKVQDVQVEENLGAKDRFKRKRG